MLGFLPAPIGDELLYSILARHRVLTGARVSRPTIEAAFGGIRKYAYIGLPGGLENLARALPGSILAPEDFANKMTLFPYFARFLTPEAYRRGWAGLMQGWTSGGFNGLSSFFGQAKGHSTLNFCQACVAADQNAHGMSAWRRVHQAPGVFVCPEHELPLRQSSVRTTVLSELIPCPDEPGAGTSLHSPLGHGRLALSVAQSTQWLLLNPGLPTKPAIMRSAMRAILLESGWLKTPESFVKNGIRETMIRTFGAENLEDLGCRVGLTGDREAWVGWLWEERDRLRAHPMRYLLMLALLRRHVSDLFLVPEAASGVKRVKVERWYHHCNRASTARHKATVIALLADYPLAGRTELRKINDAPLAYLARHEPAWLEARLPPRRSKAKCRDWGAADEALLPKVQSAIRRLQVATGRPVRVTLTSIAIEARLRSPLLSKPERLPRSIAAAKAAVEDETAFAKRRLDWAATELLRRGETFLWSDFATLGKLTGPWRPALEGYAYELFDSLRAAAALNVSVISFPELKA